jgi:MFS family permease
VAGVGNAAFWPSQSALLAGLTPQARRHGAYALQRVTRNLGIGLGGVVGGLVPRPPIRRASPSCSSSTP